MELRAVTSGGAHEAQRALPEADQGRAGAARRPRALCANRYPVSRSVLSPPCLNNSHHGALPVPAATSHSLLPPVTPYCVTEAWHDTYSKATDKHVAPGCRSGSPLDPECSPEAVTLGEDAARYLIVDTDTVLQQTDFLEHPTITDVILLTTVMQEVKARNMSVALRINKVLDNPSKRFFLFSNEFCQDTYVVQARLFLFLFPQTGLSSFPTRASGSSSVPTSSARTPTSSRRASVLRRVLLFLKPSFRQTWPVLRYCAASRLVVPRFFR